MPDSHEYITLHIEPTTITVLQGRHGRDYWYAPGLTVCIKGAFPVKRYAAAANVAMNEAIERKIAPSALKRVCSCGAKTVKVDPKQKDMFK